MIYIKTYQEIKLRPETPLGTVSFLLLSGATTHFLSMTEGQHEYDFHQLHTL